MSLDGISLGQALRADGGVIQTGPFGSQLKQAEYSGDGVPVIMPKDIQYGTVVRHTVACVTEEKAERLSRHKIAVNGIVLPRRGDIAKRAFIEEDQAGWLCGTGCLKVETTGSQIWPRYLYYHLGTPASIAWLERNGVGSTMLNLSAEIVSRLPIHVPSIDIQKRIADILSAYDDLIDNNRRRIALLEEAARLLYREWFVHFRFPGHKHVKIIDGVPEGWERRTLDELVRVVQEKVPPTEFESDDVHIGLEHMPRRSFTLCDWGAVDDLASAKWRFHAGDILFCKIRPYFHKVGFALRGGLASSDAIVLRAVEKADWPMVLSVTASDHFVAVASKTVREGSKMPRADWEVLKRYALVKPPPGVLHSFNEIVRAIARQCETLARQSRELADARDLLLPRLMNGEIAV